MRCVAASARACVDSFEIYFRGLRSGFRPPPVEVESVLKRGSCQLSVMSQAAVTAWKLTFLSIVRTVASTNPPPLLTSATTRSVPYL
jgi:hypothetical protein